MNENITSKELIAEIDKVISGYIDERKKMNIKSTRDDILEVVLDKLEDLLETNSDNKERTAVLSGVAVGIAIVLQVEERMVT